MIYKLLNKQFFKTNFFYTLIFFFWILLHITYLVQFDDYFDDWNFFFTVDPSITNNQTWQRHYFGDRGDGGILKEAFPWNFSYIAKYFLKFTEYTIEATHYFLLFFSALSYFFFYKFIKLISKDYKFILLASIIFATNLFLIRELNSLRPHSAVMLLSLLSNYLFISIFIKNKRKISNFIFYIIFTICMLSLWPHSLALLVGHFVFLLIFFLKKKKIFDLCFPLIILILYLALNYKYIIYITIENDWSYTPLSYTFFINFFFRSFFGSIFFGGIMLLIFFFYLLKEIKINFYYYKKNKYFSGAPFLKKNKQINFILINILCIYVAIILYSVLKESVIAPKYFLILIPLIIIWLSLKINEEKKKHIYNLIIIITILNCIYFWNNLPISRPPMREVLRIIDSNNIKNIYTTESTVFNNYLSHYRYAIKNNFAIEKIENLKDTEVIKNFAVVCLNYPRAFFGDSNIDSEDPKCFEVFKNKNLQIKKKIAVPDFLIFIVEIKL